MLEAFIRQQLPQVTQTGFDKAQQYEIIAFGCVVSTSNLRFGGQILMSLPSAWAARALLCVALLFLGATAWADSKIANVIVEIETEDGPVGDVFSAMFIGKNGPMGSVVSAAPMVEADLPPGDYDVLVIRTNDQKTIQLSFTATSDPVTVTAKMPSLSPEAPRMRLARITVSGAEPSDTVWSWQFVQGDRISGSRNVAEPAISVPLAVGDYVVRLRRRGEEKETRAALIVEAGEGPLDIEIDWAPRAFGDDRVAQARIIPRDPDQTNKSETPAASEGDAEASPVLIATYDAQISQIVVRIAEGADGLNGGTIWLTDGDGPGGLDVAFIDQRGEARFSTLNISSDKLAVEVRDASGLNIRARTIVEDWK